MIHSIFLSLLNRRLVILAVVSLLIPFVVTGQEKIVITEADQLPRVAYPFEGKAVELIDQPEQLSPFLEKLEAEINRQLEVYDIRDQGTLRGYLETLRTLDFLKGDLDGALEKIHTIREMHEKPADKLTAGMIVESVIEVLRKENGRDLSASPEAFERNFDAKVNALPWDIVQDSIEQMNGTFQFLSRNLYLGSLENQMQVTIDENQEMTLGDLQSLAGIRLMLESVLPLAPRIVSVTGDYIEANRVVNMSWGGDQSSIEAALEANGVGDNPEQRANIARVLFEIGYDALLKAMASAPEILFVAAAGNSDEDVDFNKVIPSSIDLPNVLVVGAVDQAGEETGFTSYGKNVKAHANGFEVESYVPGDSRVEFSGTSMAAPNVTNLAAKLLAIAPDLSPWEVKQLIQLSIDKSEDGRRFLIHPQRAVSMLRLKPGN